MPRPSRSVRSVSFAAAVALALCTAGVAAQRPSSPGNSEQAPGRAIAAQKKQISAEQRENVRQRVALAMAILDQHEAEAKSLGLASGWRQSKLESLLTLSVNKLQALQKAATLDELMAAVTAASVEPQTLGSSSEDLVYKPIAPCRYVDTRFAGGPISPNRGFDLSLPGSTYGGLAACNPTVLFGVNENQFGGIAMNVTVVAPVVPAGYAAVKPTLASPVVSLVNWYTAGPGVSVANQGILTMDQSGALEEFFVETSSAVNVIIDIFGAFIAPEATALSVQSVQTPFSITSGAYSVLATCPAGYAITGGGWNHNSGNFDGISQTQSSREGNGWRCRGWFTGPAGTTQAGYCEATCARTPGR